MVEVAQLAYESNENINTSDKFVVNIKARVEYEINSEELLIKTLDQISIDFFKHLSLLESLNLMEHGESNQTQKYIQNITENCKRKGYNILKFTLTTMEALQVEELVPVNLEIYPELEGKKKKKGLRGRLFGK